MRFEAVLRLAAKALASGGRRVSPQRVEWDVSGSCAFPRPRDVFGRADTFERSTVVTPRPGVELRFGVELYPGQRTMEVGLTVRCRHCPSCLRQRRNAWVDRALTEWGRSYRTWFVTITFKPEEHYRMLLDTKRRLSAGGIDFEELDGVERFAALHSTSGAEITKYIKRLRTNTKAKLRYLLVVEKHKEQLSGFPHYHMFIHECGTPGVTYDALRSNWGYVGNNAKNALGFMEAKLVKSEAASSYLTKYLGKNADARVRASGAYGKIRSEAYELLPLKHLAKARF